MRSCKAFIGAIVASVVLALPVAAQTSTTAPYPGTTSTTAAPTSQNVGALAAGQETTITSCGFTGGGTVTVAVNGRGGGSGSVGADGCTSTTVSVLGANQVRVAGVVFDANCGANSVGVTSGSRTVTTTFTVDCADGLPRTGSSVLPWVLAGAGLVAVGLAVVVAGRRRSTASH